MKVQGKTQVIKFKDCRDQLVKPNFHYSYTPFLSNVPGNSKKNMSLSFGKIRAKKRNSRGKFASDA